MAAIRCDQRVSRRFPGSGDVTFVVVGEPVRENRNRPASGPSVRSSASASASGSEGRRSSGGVAARATIEGISHRCGLDAGELEDWITAVNELMINVVRHGGGRGTVCLFMDDRFTWEVTDHGPGFDIAR